MGQRMRDQNGVQAKKDIELLRQAFAQDSGDLDVGLLLGSSLYQIGSYADSALVLKSVLAQYPDHAQALLLLARAQARAGDIADAIKTLNHAQKIEPSNPLASQVASSLAVQIRDWPALLRIAKPWTQSHPNSCEAWQALSQAHFEESRFSEAIAAFKPVLELAPGNALHLVSAARLAIAATRYGDARLLLNSAKEIAPESGELLFTFSRLYHMTGELIMAEDYCRRAIAISPRFAPAYVALGTLREGRLDVPDIQVIDNLCQDESIHSEYRAMLGFTLGDALDRRGKYDHAFTAWENANSISRAVSEREGFHYRHQQVEDEPKMLAEIFSPPIVRSVEVQACNRPRPIFVVGMPRSGTTLVESILASHSTVYGAGELPTLYDIHEDLMTVARERGVKAARAMICVEACSWRQRYLSALPAINDETYVVDKQPLNFRSVALIRLLFPESPIIYTQRPPMDVGLSIFRHKFSKNWPCAHSLSDIGHYYAVHVQICALWQRLYADAIHVVDHSMLVANPEFEIHRLLSFVGLDFESACFAPHKTKRPIATFSSVQVRQPLSSAYSNRSARYASALTPLYEALRRGNVDVEN